MTISFDDGYESHKVLAIGKDDDKYHKQPGITTKTGWCALGYYAEKYANIPQNADLTRLCKSLYPEYFI